MELTIFSHSVHHFLDKRVIYIGDMADSLWTGAYHNLPLINKDAASHAH